MIYFLNTIYQSDRNASRLHIFIFINTSNSLFTIATRDNKLG